jgi:hypothetical protein
VTSLSSKREVASFRNYNSKQSYIPIMLNKVGAVAQGNWRLLEKGKKRFATKENSKPHDKYLSACKWLGTRRVSAARAGR